MAFTGNTCFLHLFAQINANKKELIDYYNQATLQNYLNTTDPITGFDLTQIRNTPLKRVPDPLDLKKDLENFSFENNISNLAIILKKNKIDLLLSSLKKGLYKFLSSSQYSYEGDWKFFITNLIGDFRRQSFTTNAPCNSDISKTEFSSLNRDFTKSVN